ncbi:RecQ family ATP-dependent DNA helicase [Agathobacter rectalis]|jgi:ATP-dependent DNA helicase RecQ|uniref:ATP-dependent DNA helicase RecQ n=1 Tax=Agathobacter rectalis TaxID=39491 RepID=A0A412Q2Z3_9FIRM|nr:RecQ family ATP-dependent DNA helicase [Agathobacter rectalis]RGT76689.1 RecQ family ATP-dependent DNA helicase [Agathobacter rectalis]RGT80982.1 RecQ family ATP-dependent DNA helicase [Agathobacter rectalis]
MNINQTLKQYFGYDSLRTGQEELINGILAGHDVLGIMPTGAGKSLCYQLPALMLKGITLVISPLISLMSDQVKALNQAGVHAAYINSSLTENQVRMALSYASQGRYKIIYVAPERLNTPRFLDFACNADISMLTVDEAHCISQWGQDFRPSYLEIAGFLTRLPRRPIVSAFTATATERVKNDIVASLGLNNPVTMVTGFDRPNLFFRVVTRKGGSQKDNSIINYVKKHEDESGIIYCATKKNVDKLYTLLNEQGISAGRYHAGLSNDERKQNQEDFTYDRIRVMVATNAFGMGIDKSNVRYVLHYNMPQSLEYYYQEAGRAGRDGEEAECVLFFSKQDIMINKFLLQNKASAGDVASDMQKTANDQRKLQQMINYCETDKCLREFILSYFGDTTPCICNKCSNCVVVEDEEEKTYVETGKKRKKAAQLAGLNELGAALFEKLRSVRTELAAEKSVPPYIICSDKTLKDICAKLPRDKEQLADVYGMGEQKIQNYGEAFVTAVNSFVADNPNPSGSTTGERPQTVLSDEEAAETGSTRKKKLPFYIEPQKLDEVELTDKCRLTELTNKINELCPADKEHKKLAASFINELLIAEGYLEEVTEDGNKIKRVTEKGRSVGIDEEERKAKFGGTYYAITHSKQSQQVIIEMLKKHYGSIKPQE